MAALDWYLFQLTVLLISDSNLSNSFTYSWVNQVMTGTGSLALVIANVGTYSLIASDVKMQYADSIKISLI